mmetsp:Transcript_5225/g.10427  ORF Transcript_5225/g.10427 Transcript_5225/m.10427 type:complete len:250 (+) Transcript_5225:3-752(+)
MVGVNWEGKEREDDKKDNNNSQKFEGVKPTNPIKADSDEDSNSPLTFCLSPNATPAVKTLLKTDHLGTAKGVEEGAVVEIGAEGYGVMEQLTSRLTRSPGALLIIDYGPSSGVPGDTIRGFKDHKVSSLLGEVGEVDVTADVDFGGLKKAGERRIELLYKKKGESKPEQPHPRLHGPTPQGKFLMELGLGTRVQSIIESPSTSKEEANLAYQGMEKLVVEMGERFQVLAVAGGGMKGVKGVAGGKMIGF